MTLSTADMPQAAAPQRSSFLAGLSVMYLACFVAGAVLNGVMTGGARLPTPYSPLHAIQDYYLKYAEAARFAAFSQFASAVLLGLFTAAIAPRLAPLRHKGTEVCVGLLGGMAAAISLALSALAGWTLSQTGIAEEIAALRAVQLLGFATGGVGYVVFIGLLLAGVSAACGSALPRWITYLGFFAAACAELSILSMVFPQVSFLLPLGRFPAFIWMIGVGFTLPAMSNVENQRRNGAF